MCQESGLYYLQSRYYDPEVGRFLNADSYTSTGQGILGHNMFAYCGNNPTVYSDYSGRMFQIAFAADMYAGSALPNPEPIMNQTQEPYGSMPLGSATVAHGGCGPVAAYNTLQLLRRFDISFEDVLRCYETHNFLNADGTLGTTISGCMYFLHVKGYDVHATMDISQFDNMAESADACVLWYMYQQDTFPFVGAHFVSFKQAESIGVYYNLYSNRCTPYSFSGGCSSFVKTQGYFVPILITVDKK